jgi:hypothetical protein
MLTSEHHPSQGIHNAGIKSTADQNNLRLVFLEGGLNYFLENEGIGRPSTARRKRDIYIVVYALICAYFGDETRIKRIVTVLVD